MATDVSEPSLFAKNLVATLLPFFQAYSYPSEVAVQTEVVQTLTSYGATTRGGMLHAALSIAFGFSALEALAEAKQNPDLSPTQVQRIRAGANTLSRACQQNAGLATARPACEAPKPAAIAKPDRPVAGRPATKPAQPASRPELSDAEITEILRQADAMINAGRRPRAQPPAPVGSAPHGSALAGSAPSATASGDRQSVLAQRFFEAVRSA